MKSINIFDYAIELLLILRNKSIVTKIMFNHKEYHLLLYLFKIEVLILSTKQKHIPCLITIFGATGDLSHRKLFPSIFHLYQQDNLDEHIAIIGIGRRDYNNEQFRDQVKASIQTYVKDTDRIDEFMTHVFIIKLT